MRLKLLPDLNTITYIQTGLIFGAFSICATKSLQAEECHLESPVMGIFDIHPALKSAQLLNVTKTFSLQLCGASCCNVRNCNAYIWSKNEKCLLFHCKVLGDCKVKPNQNTMTGFIRREAKNGNKGNTKELKQKDMESAKNVSETSQLSVSKVEENTAVGVTNLKPKLLVTGKPEVPNEVVDSIEKKEAVPQSSHSKDATETKNGRKTAMLSTSRGNRTKLTRFNQTNRSIPILTMSTASQKITHTTTTSLIAAFVFGVIFLIAVAVQIGKPWWESLFADRVGYNRITFLMNGK